MKHPILAASLLAVAASVSRGAPSDFQGKLDIQITRDRVPMHLTYYVKGNCARTEMASDNGRTMVMLVDFGKHELTFLMPEQRMYLVRPLPTPSAGSETAADEGNPPEVKRTGEYQTILGHKCEKILVTSQNETTEVWAAEGMGSFMSPGMPGMMGRRATHPRSAWEAELFQRGFFPLRVVTRDANGKETQRMEVTAIDTSPLSDTLFAPPSDYKKFEMPALPGMGGMNPFNR